MFKNTFKVLILSVAAFVTAQIVYAQTASILPPAKTTFFDSNGKPLANGKIDFYIPGTTTRKMTWQDAGETIPNTNPVVLDTAGRAIILGDGSYRQRVTDKNGNLIWDQITSSTGSGGGGGSATVGDGDAVGTIKAWSGFIAPSQYVFAYGQEFVRASYPELFAAITSQQNVSCTSGSPTLTGLSDTSQLPIGTPIETSCLNSGATIISKTTSTVVASSNAIISTSTSVRFFPFGNGDGNLTFTLPDLRGFTIAGRDNMGGIAANRLSLSGLGSSGGGQNHTLSQSELPNVNFTVNIPAGQGAHSHTYTNYPPTGTVIVSNNVSALPQQATATATTSTATLPAMSGTAASGGSGTAFSILQPTQIQNYIIKVLPDTNPNSYFGVASIGGMYGVIDCGVGITCTGNTISAINSTLIPPTPTVLGGVFSATCSTSNWFNTLDTTGAFGCSQPSFTDILGTLAVNKGGTGATSFTANLPLIGNGTGAIAQGSRSGNTTTFATTNGSLINGNCLTSDISGNLVDAGSPCGGGGSGSIANIAALKALAPGVSPSVYVNGYVTSGDGGQGWFSWDNSSSVADNSCTIFQPSSLPTTGRWIRQIPVKGDISVAWCGAFPDNTTDIGPVLNNIITNILPASGGKIIFPAAAVNGNQYAIATTVVTKRYVTFQGAGGGEQTSGAATNVSLIWTGSTSTPRIIDARDTYNFVWDNITLYVQASYTGIMIDIGSATFGNVSFYPDIRNSSFVSLGTFGTSNVTCIMANRTIVWTVDRSQFINCKYGIFGRNDPDTMAIQSTTGTITRNQFYRNQFALYSGGNGWAVTYNTFEGDHLARAQAFTTGNSLKSISMYFAYNWMGDVTTTGGAWFNLATSAYNLTIANNFIGGDSGSDVLYAGGTSTISGLNASNNYLDTFGVAFYLDTGLTITGGTFQNNVGNNVANCTSGTNGASLQIIRFGNTGFTNACELGSFGTNGWRVNPDGTIEQWGQITGVAAGGSSTVTFPRTFPTSCYNVVVSATSPSVSAFGAPYAAACNTSSVVVSSMGSSGTSTISWRAIGK